MIRIIRVKDEDNQSANEMDCSYSSTDRASASGAEDASSILAKSAT